MLEKKGTPGRRDEKVCPFLPIPTEKWSWSRAGVKELSFPQTSRGLPGSLEVSAARESLTLPSPSPAGLMTRWDLDNSCPVFHHTANMEERRAFKRSFPPSLPPACGVSGNRGFPAAFHIRISGPGRRQQWGSVRVFGLLGNQARTRRGKTLGVLQSA